MKTCKHCNTEYVYINKLHRSSTASPSYCSKECRNEVRKQVNANNKLRSKRKEEEGDELYWIINKRLSAIKSSAKQRNIDFNLKPSDVIPYYKKKCYYCNGSVKNINLDRIENDKGYISDNIVSCCLTCNKMKLEQVQHDFINMCKKIALNHASI